MAYRLYERSQVFFDNLGQPLAGGRAEFYEAGGTDPQVVYSDSALGVNLGSTETLDSAGRFATGIWGVGDYRVRFYTDDDVLVSEDDPITDPAGAATNIPSLSGNANKLLSNNGAILQWVEYLTKLLPDMTGHADKILTTDGFNALWKSAVEAGLPDVDDTSESTIVNYVLGPWRILLGSATLPVPSVTPPHGAVVAVTFPEAFAATPIFYGAFGNKHSVASHDYKPVVSTEATSTGLTIQYNINENSTDASADIATTVRVSWGAAGLA